MIPGRFFFSKWAKMLGNRTRPGDFEAILIMGRKRKSAEGVVTYRASRNSKIRKLDDNYCKGIKKALTKELGNVTHPVHTITFDNDKAFSCHQDVVRLIGIETYLPRLTPAMTRGHSETG
jgi:IS30 family transposase